RSCTQRNVSTCKVSLREVCGAGEPLNPEVIDQVRAAWGLTIRDGYGQTETAAIVGNSPGQTVKIGSTGPAAARALREEPRPRRPRDQGRRGDAQARRRSTRRPDAGLSGRGRQAFGRRGHD